MRTVTIMMPTMNRHEIACSTWQTNIANAMVNLSPEIKLEFMVCDNGSSDPRVAEHFSKLGLHYFRKNSVNEGVGKAMNQMFLRSTGQYIASFGNDLVNPPGWLQECVNYCDALGGNIGIVGIDWGHGGVPPLSVRHGSIAHWLTPQLNRVFGTWVMRREVIERVGFFCEEYDVYGLEDSDFNEKVNRAGFNSCYVPNMKCQHLCHDVGAKTDYRKMKDASMTKNLQLFWQRVERMDRGEALVDPLPVLREAT